MIFRKTRRLPLGWPTPTLRDHIAGSWEVFVEDWQALTGREPTPRTPEENRARNIRRIMLRKRSVITRVPGRWFEAREWVERHITQRELHRKLDAARLLLAPPEWDEKAALERLRRDLAQRIADGNTGSTS